MGRRRKLKGRPPWLEDGYQPKSRGECHECSKHVYKKPYYYGNLVFHQHCFPVWFKRQVKKGKV